MLHEQALTVTPFVVDLALCEIRLDTVLNRAVQEVEPHDIKIVVDSCELQHDVRRITEVHEPLASRIDDHSVLMITHYQRLLDYIVPDYIHVMSDGKIIKSGDKSLALELEEKGYGWIDQDAA